MKNSKVKTINKDKAREIAKEFLVENLQVVDGVSEYLEDDKEWYFYQPNQGGAQIIVGEDGTFLLATSHVGPMRLAETWHLGFRSTKKLEYF